MFEKKDFINLVNLKEMIRDNLKLDNVDCQKVSKIYHVFTWIESIEDKMKSSIELEEKLQQMKYELRQKEIEIVELKKPKRRTRKKKTEK